MCGAIELGYSVMVLGIPISEELEIKLHVVIIRFIVSYIDIQSVKMNDQTVIGLCRTQEAEKSLNCTANDTRTSRNNAAKLATCVRIRKLKKLRILRRSRRQGRLKNGYIFYLRISGYSQVINFVYPVKTITKQNLEYRNKFT